MNDSHRFQVDLSGLISVLSEHLYGGPEVFVRELLQNCLDAQTARRQLQPKHSGFIRIEVREEAGEIIFTDDGIGLDRAGVHRFLSTIGQSSKRSTLERPTDFIGQFGIGLLSAFMVTDEVEAITR
ncbi:MAG: molecular chaperone HtpG, partial [Bradymonadia bacterium]